MLLFCFRPRQPQVGVNAHLRRCGISVKGGIIDDWRLPQVEISRKNNDKRKISRGLIQTLWRAAAKGLYASAQGKSPVTAACLWGDTIASGATFLGSHTGMTIETREYEMPAHKHYGLELPSDCSDKIELIHWHPRKSSQ